MPGQPYVDFYSRHHISPVYQDVSDLARHYGRRRSLYRQLGLPAHLLQGRSVLEFGPGSGHNALFTASCGPSHYTLVDANPRALADLPGMLEGSAKPGTEIEIVESLFHDFRPGRRYDVVLAEGCIPMQTDPQLTLRTIARHVASAGVLVVTCVSATSYLSETIRRLLRDRVIRCDAHPSEQLPLLRTLLGPHYETLRSRSRPLDDWIWDTVLHPWEGTFLPVDAAVSALSGSFDLLSSSPRFFTDLRWYKDVREPDSALAEACCEQYYANAINFLDYRLTVGAVHPGIGRRIEAACQLVWDEMRALEALGAGPDSDFAPALEGLKAVADLVEPGSEITARSIRTAIEDLRRGVLPSPLHPGDFHTMWGRGQTYVSFIRSEDSDET